MFRCISYAHGPNNTQRKLELKSIRCVFFRYGENVGVKGYNLYNLATRKSFYTWDVIFDEHYVVLPSKSTNVSTTFTYVSKLESNPMPLVNDQDHTNYYFENGSFLVFNQGGIPSVLPPPLTLQPIGPSLLRNLLLLSQWSLFSSYLPFDLDDIYEIAPNLDDSNSLMTPHVPSIQQKVNIFPQSTKIWISHD